MTFIERQLVFRPADNFADSFKFGEVALALAALSCLKVGKATQQCPMDIANQ